MIRIKFWVIAYLKEEEEKERLWCKRGPQSRFVIRKEHFIFLFSAH